MKTINNVPRELLDLCYRALNGGDNRLTGMEHGRAFRELRALLDAPECRTTTALACPGDGVGPCKECPGDKGRGEPVACAHEWNDDGEFLLVCTECGAKEDYNNALKLAFELGGTDDGDYHLEADELVRVIQSYAEQPAPQKYDDTLLPFLALMRKELHANSHKGDRDGWLGMTASAAIGEVEHHYKKLSVAVATCNDRAIKEHAADVANCAMMLADVCGVLGRA